jgi:hypothetical protein
MKIENWFELIYGYTSVSYFSASSEYTKIYTQCAEIINLGGNRNDVIEFLQLYKALKEL